MDSKFYEEIGQAVELATKNGGDLTSQNLKYVVKVALDLSQKSGVSLDELIAEGVIGMREAEMKYDPTQNDNFTKYCALSVRGKMLNLINRGNSLVHIPVNHLKGFSKGQEAKEETKVTYDHIDGSNYDTLGLCDTDAFRLDRETILYNGLATLEETSRNVMMMKLHLGKYAEMVPSKTDPNKMEYKYKNNMQAIAEELDLTPKYAKMIYEEAFEKLSAYCQREDNNTL